MDASRAAGRTGRGYQQYAGVREGAFAGFLPDASREPAENQMSRRKAGATATGSVLDYICGDVVVLGEGILE